jgi:biopolymer transport protein ExbD
MSFGKSLLRPEFVFGVVVGALLASLGATAFMIGRVDPVAPPPVVFPTGEPVGITVTEAGHVFLGSREISRSQLVPALRAAFQRAGHNHLTITIDRKLGREDVADVFAASKRAGARGLTVTAE